MHNSYGCGIKLKKAAAGVQEKDKEREIQSRRFAIYSFGGLVPLSSHVGIVKYYK